jgi:glycosyltransferase involved in cell wall biosynthesis
MSQLSVVVPAFNEERGLATVLKRVLDAGEQVRRQHADITAVEVIVVDDGSTDSTAAVAGAMPAISLIRHPANRGYGAALKTGFANARGDYLAFLDADATYPPETLPALVGALLERRADVVVGTRMSDPKGGMPKIRALGNWLFARLLSWVVEARVTDCASGIRVFRRAILDDILDLPDGFNFIVAMSTVTMHKGLRVVEVPIPYFSRVGESKLRVIADGVAFLISIVGVAISYNPLKFIGPFGMACIGVALYLSIDPILYYLQNRRVEDDGLYRLITISVLAVSGLHIINFGLFSNALLARSLGEAPDRRSVLGRLLLRSPIMRLGGVLGSALCLGAVVLNYRALIQYLTTGTIQEHWSYVLTGGSMFLVGLQLMMSGLLLRIVGIRTEKRRRGVRDLPGVDVTPRAVDR